MEHSSFVPVVVSFDGGAGPAASTVLKRLASLIADHRLVSYSFTTAGLKTRLSFALLRFAVMCLRGVRSSPRVGGCASIPLVVGEGRN